MKITETGKKIIIFSTIILILLILPLILLLVKKKQLTSKRAEVPERTITLKLQPAESQYSLGQTKFFNLTATINDGSPQETLSFVKTIISFPTQYLEMPEDQYVDVSQSSLGRVFRLDGPTQANESGIITIELGASSPDSGPSTDQQITIARIPLKAVNQTSSTQQITIGESQIINNQAAVIATESQAANFTVGEREIIPQATLSLEPISADFSVNQTKFFNLTATISDGSPQETLSFVKTIISFPTQYLEMPEDQYVDVSQSSLGRVFRLDGPTQANESGIITIELGASTPDSGPSTDQQITIARIPLKAVNQTSSTQQITIGDSQIINNQAVSLPVTGQNSTFTVGGGGATLTFNIAFQGVSSTNCNQTIMVTLKKGEQERYRFDDVSINPVQDGVYEGTINGLVPDTYDIFIKGWAHLAKKFENITIGEGENNQDFSQTTLPVGDFNDNNILDITDVTAIIAKYTTLSNPVTDENRIFDVDCNNKINIFDPSLALTNYVDLEIPGD